MTDSGADRVYIVKHSALKGYQTLSLAGPVVYLGASLMKRTQPFSINRLLKTTWYANTAGSVLGAGLGFLRLQKATDVSLQDRRVRLQYNITQRRADDYSIIGSTVGALSTSVLFWNRARIATLILGGAGLGSAVGILTHLSRSISEGQGVSPDGMQGV